MPGSADAVKGVPEDGPEGGPEGWPGAKRKKKNRRSKTKKRRRYKQGEVAEEEEEEQQPPVAPVNTTQFLMEQHDGQYDLDWQVRRSSGCRPEESEEDYWHYFSPRAEEFLTKEFANTYDHVHAERLGSMSKTELIQEYLQLEERVDRMEKRLRQVRAKDRVLRGRDSDEEMGRGEMRMDPEVAEKIRIFQQEIGRLVEENGQLQRERDALQAEAFLDVPLHVASSTDTSSSSSSSVDSESDSTTTTSSCSTSSCCSPSSPSEGGDEETVPASDAEPFGETPCQFTLFATKESVLSEGVVPETGEEAAYGDDEGFAELLRNGGLVMRTVLNGQQQ